jgi:heme-degrading monooxygenase HmoA
VFARMATYELVDGRGDEWVDAFRSAIDRIRTLDGLVDAFFLVERNGRQAISLTLWDTLDSMERSGVAAAAARMDAAHEAGAVVTSALELEVGIRASGEVSSA